MWQSTYSPEPSLDQSSLHDSDDDNEQSHEGSLGRCFDKFPNKTTLTVPDQHHWFVGSSMFWLFVKFIGLISLPNLPNHLFDSLTLDLVVQRSPVSTRAIAICYRVRGQGTQL